MKAIYVCYFGIGEPLVQTQVLPYLRELARGGVAMSLLTFEPVEPVHQWREDGIEWHWLRYHKHPLAKLFDIVAGALRIARLGRFDIVHGRSHVGAAVGALAKKLTGARLIFDMRGFLADEYVDSGHWRANGLLFRVTKAAEHWLLRIADGVVTLTDAAKVERAAVIPCCVDNQRFAVEPALLGITNRVVYAYAGTVYQPRELAEFLSVARRIDPRTFALILTRDATIAAELERAGFTRDDYRVLSVTPEDVPRYLRAADVGLIVVNPSYARRAMSPTKFAEYLAAGLPVIATPGIGDLDAHIEEERVGVLLRDPEDAIRAIDELRRDPQLAERCREVARRRYDLRGVGGARYRRLYDSVLQRRIRVLALATYPVEAASSRFRITQLIEPLAQRGIDVTFSPFLDASLFAVLYSPAKLIPRLPRLAWRAVRRIFDAFHAADVVLVQREAMLFGPPLVERLLRAPMVLDLDDATYLDAVSPVYGRFASLLKWRGKTETLIRRAKVVTCGNETIAAHVGAKAIVVPSAVDLRLFHPELKNDAVPVIGWIGTHSTYPFFERLLPILERLAREATFRVSVIGGGRGSRAWSLEREPEDFRALDIGVYPIADDAWSAGKSGLKAVQYMASGVPFVMSPVGVCATMGIAGTTHFLAVTDDEWLEALRRLVADRELRERMGAAGRAFAETHHSLEAQADVLASVIRQVAS